MAENRYNEAINEIALSKEKLESTLEIIRNYNTDKESNFMKKKAIKITAVAASLAIVAGAGTFFSLNNSTPESNNNFIMTVNAAEINKNNEVLLSSNDFNGYGISFSDDGENLYYDLSMPIACKGENLESITYSVNEGAFRIWDITGNSFTDIKETAEIYSEDSSGKLTDLIIENDEDKSIFCNEFTVKAKSQDTDKVFIGIVGKTDDLDNTRKKKVKSDNKEYSSKDFADIKAQKKLADDFFGGNVIKCTAKFTDGTTQTKNVKLGTTITTCKEGIKDYEEYLNTREMTKDAIQKELEREALFVTFTLSD